jgi:hypothetical protein
MRQCAYCTVPIEKPATTLCILSSKRRKCDDAIAPGRGTRGVLAKGVFARGDFGRGRAEAQSLHEQVCDEMSSGMPLTLLPSIHHSDMPHC